MKVYLISNYYKIEESNIKINNDDLVILFNHSFPIKFNKIKNHKNKWIFIRANPKSYWGFDKLLENHNLYEKIILIGPPRTNSIEKLKLNGIKFELTNIPNVESYEKNKSPTSGFIGYLNIKNEYKLEDIILVNFTGESSNGGNGWSGHDYKFEQEYYKNKNIKKEIW
jgi:hypothetical protein